MTTLPDFHNKLVKKPWGNEYLLYENDEVSLWHLKIKEKHETSLHSHPTKKTGLIVLSGCASISFLNGSENRVFPAEKVMIRQGVFHKTKASVGDVELLEIETPKDKLDIVRLKDAYGRANQPYEDESHYESYASQTLPMSEHNEIIKLGRCRATVQRIVPQAFKADEKFTYIILKGQIKSGDFVVAGPGDVSYGKQLDLMLEQFTPDKELLTLTLYYPC